MQKETIRPKAKRAWITPRIEQLAVSEAMLRLMRSHERTSLALREIEALAERQKTKSSSGL